MTPPPAAAQWNIRRIGAKGDGIADDGSGNTAYIPFTLPGERVTASINDGRGEPLAIVEPSLERVAPPCPHFTDCGGCSLQHWQRSSYEEWKTDRLTEALSGRGIDIELQPLVSCPPHARRRVTLGARRMEGGILLGFHAALSNRIVPIETCIIAEPAIVAALPMLRELAALAAHGSEPFSLAVTVTETGVDVALVDLPPPGEKKRQTLIGFALKNGLARLSRGDEIIVEPIKPVVTFGATKIFPPPGAFLQAVESAEEAMAALVVSHLKGCKTVADLFAGCGTFALRLARKAAVHAVEADAAPLVALERGFRFGEKLRQVTIERRDLFDRPLTWKELKPFDGIVFDPPRAGAEAQCRQLAKSQVPKIAAVSCNPVTLARDLAILIEGGYRLRSVTPVDQFLWSHHLETVALLEKPVARRRR